MSGKRITGIILALLGSIGCYYYIGGYFNCENKLKNVWGSCDVILENYFPMMIGSGAALLLGLVLIFKKEKTSIQGGTSNFNFGAGLGIPHPDTHVKCPDCRELVLNEAKVCKHCGCKLIPQGINQEPKGVNVPTAAATVINNNEQVVNQDELTKYGITFDGEKYRYKDYKYDKLQDAINYAKKKIL